jgi:predicted MFS family arabinose efflux permease
MPSTTPLTAVRRLLALSITARLPEAMLGIGLIAHTQRLTGSFAAAGVVASVYGLALGLSGPVLGRVVDRRGQTRVLAIAAGVQAALLLAIAILPGHTPTLALVLLATGIGLATPPVGACLRARLPSLVPDAAALDRAYALETSILELTWIGGPPVVLALGALWSTGGALAIAGLVLLVSTIAYVVEPSSRGPAPMAGAERPRGGSLRTPAMRTLVIALLGAGVLLGADEVAVTAAAKTISGTTASAAPLLALWGVGSLAGGLLFSRYGGRLGRTGGLLLGLAALAAGHLALIGVTGSYGGLAVVLLLAGAAIAPTEAAAYAIVESAAPAGTVTEAFSWLFTATAVGSAGGAAAAGLLVDQVGPAGALGLGAGACALAALVTALRVGTLPSDGAGGRLCAAERG